MDTNAWKTTALGGVPRTFTPRQRNCRFHSRKAETQVAGFIVFYPHDDHVHIENVAVYPKFQGIGHGTKLIEFAERQAKSLGFSKVELYTNEKMTENIAYYPSLGYNEIGRWGEGGFNRVFFRKGL